MPKSLSPRSMVEFIIYTSRAFVQHECTQSAGMLTYTTLFAFVPLMTVIYKILSLFPALQDAPKRISDVISHHLVPGSGEQVLMELNAFSSQASKLTIVGLFVLIITAILMIRKIEWTFNKIWEVDEARNGIKTVMIYWSVLSLGSILIGIGLALSPVISELSLLISSKETLRLQSQFITLLPFISYSIAFSLMYMAIPNCYVPIKPAIIGGVLAAILFETGKKIFGEFASIFTSYQVIYGAFAAIPLFILWIYISWNIILFGVVFVKSLVVFVPKSMQKAHQGLLVLLHIIDFCRKTQLNGKLVSPEEMKNYLSKLTDVDWGEIRSVLLNNNIIQKTEEGDFALIADLHNLKVHDLLNISPWTLSELKTLAAYQGDNPWENTLAQKWLSVENQISNEFDLSVNELFTGNK